ncbi:fungal-specific transcription factor domain-containing protein [Rhexocercosporidium sp. MPI-PUGE-AT-0058]|nr:fungal-specific transcription factor domain-containing protein [Rhexocercosporidium sp. MPI-PUGE-AT-0058]
MPPQSKSSTGCWTCRLRHKKCDETTPVCSTCGALEITCLYDSTKPDWMDGGKRQQAAAERVKSDIKRAATRRRGRKRIQNIERSIGDDDLEGHVASPEPFGEVSGSLPSLGSRNGGSREHSQDLSNASKSERSSGLGIHTPESSVSLNTWSFSNNSKVPDPSSIPLSQDERELSLIMSYLDYVFPVLFPFYRPFILEGSRSWLLVLIMKNKGTYHTIISLTSFFFSVVPVTSRSDYKMCESMNSEELQKQADLAIKTVLHDSLELSAQKEQPLRESADLMANVVQLLSFEIIIAPTQNWMMHLDAAIILFEQIFESYGMDASSPSLAKVLAQLSDAPSMDLGPNITLWTADHAAFRFFSAILLVNDIISSTSLEQAPRLQKYHKYLLTDDNASGDVPLQLEDFVGHENWVLLLIGEISTLDAWKKEQKKAGALSMMQLVEKASDIDQRLRIGLARLDNPNHSSRLSSKPVNPLAFFLPQPLDISRALTKIWAYAAQIYLHTAVSGWQPANTEITANVANLILSFQNLPSPALLRTLVWPFCIAGCLASEQQESTFRDLVAAMGPLQMFGTVRLALRIMEDVWGRRGSVEIERGDWDVAACLRSVGHRVLLV